MFSPEFPTEAGRKLDVLSTFNLRPVSTELLTHT